MFFAQTPAPWRLHTFAIHSIKTKLRVKDNKADIDQINDEIFIFNIFSEKALKITKYERKWSKNEALA